MSKHSQILLLEDVDKLGRKGAVVTVKPGYARNYLLPQQKAVVANAQALRMQQRLQEERAQQAAQDKEQAEAVKSRVNGISVKTVVKVDPIGHMYGSVGEADIVQLLSQEGIVVEKREIALSKSIKKTGSYEISLNLKEDVAAVFTLNVVAEGQEVQEESKEEEQQ